MTTRRRVLAVAVLPLLLGACTTGPAGRGASRAPATRVAPAPSAPAQAPSTTRTLRVVGLGDSVMAGTNCGCAGLAEEYGTALGKRTGDAVSVSNLGIGGTVTDDLLEDLSHDSTTQSAISRADVVLVTIGANDLLPQLAEWESTGCDRSCFQGPAVRMGHNLAQVLARIDVLRRGHRGSVLVTDYWNVFTDGDVARSTGGQAQLDWSAEVTAAANQQICAAVESAGDTCVDLVPVFKPGAADPTPLLADDGDHPNAAGMGRIVQALLAVTPAAQP